MNVIVTVPPYADFIQEVCAHRCVQGLRLNTVMPLADPIEDVLQKLASFGKPLWIDLKGRQLRVKECAVPPFTEVRLSHAIRIPTPCDAYFSDGRERVRVLACRGDRLILEDGPRRLVGPGESVNLPCPHLVVEGTLTETDRAYLSAMKKLGLKNVMLSYAETEEDASEVRQLLPGADLVLKIETARGLDLARRAGSSLGRLMAARGDLFVEVLRPHRLPRALRHIVQADREAIVASRFFPSLANGLPVQASEVTDLAYLLEIGYRTFMLGDEICLRQHSVLEALGLMEALFEENFSVAAS